MSGPSVYLTVPSWDLLKFPPDPLPPTLPPPIGERTLRAPFGIQPWLFNLAMHPAVPFGFAFAYVLIVLGVNAYNRSRDNKPWWISQQKPFHYFVVVHNVVLAIYSAATFFAMLRAISNTLPDLASEGGAAGVADALCKLHGPRVLGDAITYNTTLNIWESKNQLIRLTNTGNPFTTDVGRLWNEGLAFWGWMFYLSKFYEVVDTLIIVAKGKRSPTLQTYHHAGAMLCMWAGMRYMSAPIWMFVFVNSAIHAMMYVYFALAAVDIKVPRRIKRTLTTMQIAQFIWGVVYAGLHLFIAYDIPVATPYKVAGKVAAVASSASSAFVSATSVVSAAVVSPTGSQALGLLIKKLLLRAAGEEGPAERIGLPTDKPIAESIESRLEEARERVFHQPVYETKWRTDYTKVNCIDTSGQAMAIWLNLLYLAPLTVLFARFFYKSYLARGKPQNVSEAAKQIAQDAKYAEAETERTVEEAGKRAEDVVRDRGSDVKKEIKSLHQQLKEDVQKMKDGNYGAKVKERIESFEKQVKEAAGKAQDQVKDTAGKAKDQAKNTAGKAKDAAGKAKDQAMDAAGKLKEQAKDTAGKVKEQAKDTADKANDQAQRTPRSGSPVKEDRADNDHPASANEQTPEKKKHKKKHNKNKNKDNTGEGKADSEPGSPGSGSEDKQDTLPEAAEGNKDKSKPTDDGTSKSKPTEDNASKSSPKDNSDKSKPKDNADKSKPKDNADQSNSEDNKGESKAESEKVPAADESVEKQDAVLEATEPTRPGLDDEDTDAMGKSGVGIKSDDSKGDASES